MKIKFSSVKSRIVSIVVLMVATSAYCGIGEGSFGQAQVIVPAPADAARQHLAWPKVVRTANGKLVVACVSAAKHTGNAGGLEAVAVSADGGATFSALDVLAKPEGDERWTEGGNIALGMSVDRVVMLSMTYASDGSTSGIYGRISGDGGTTWSVTDTSEVSPDKTGSVFGHIIDLPGRGLTAFGHYRPPARAKNGGIWMASSPDNGATWGAPTRILDRDGFVEPDFVCSQSRIIGLIREDLGNSETLNGYWQVVSDDNGATWSEPVVVMTGAAGDQSAAPCIVEDAQNPGRLYALQTVRRGIYGAAESSGEIVVWTAEAATLKWRRIGRIASFTGIEDFGYASAAQIAGNEWFVVFYAGAMNGASSIYGARCTFDANQPPLVTHCAKLENGLLSMTADCFADGRLWLVSGARDGGDRLSHWDNVTRLQDVAAGDRITVNENLPEGAAFARIVLRDVVHSVTVVTNDCYLEGDGDQYLEVDYKLKSTDRVVARVMGYDDVANNVDGNKRQTGIFGSRAGASDRNICALWARNAGAIFQSGVSGSVVLDFNSSNYETYRQDWDNLQTNTLYTIEMSKAERNVLQDGQKIPSRTGDKGICPDVFETSTNCRLFDIPNRPGSYAHCFIGRFYSFKIYQGSDESPIRDLVPFVEDGQAKMKDLVTGAIYHNLGTGEFRFGADETVIEEESDGSALGWGPCVVTAAVPSGSVEPVVTPPGYVDVFPNVCVETGVKLKSSDRVEVKVRMLDWPWDPQAVFCQRDRNVSGAPNRFFLLCSCYSGTADSCKWNFDYYNVHNNDYRFGAISLDDDCELVCSTNGLFCNGVKAGYVPTYADFEANSTMQLFASRNATTDVANNFAKLRFYWLRVYNAAGALTTEILPRERTTGGSADNDGCVLVRKYVDGALFSEEEKVNESGLSGAMKAEPSAGEEFPARQIVASCACNGALVASVSGGAAVNLYLASGTRKGGSNPASWENLTFVTAVPEGARGLSYSVYVPSGARYARAFLGIGPTAGAPSGITVVSVGPCVLLKPQGLLILFK